jgi:hypothetical protein
LRVLLASFHLVPHISFFLSFDEDSSLFSRMAYYSSNLDYLRILPDGYELIHAGVWLPCAVGTLRYRCGCHRSRSSHLPFGPFAVFPAISSRPPLLFLTHPVLFGATPLLNSPLVSSPLTLSSELRPPSIR